MSSDAVETMWTNNVVAESQTAVPMDVENAIVLVGKVQGVEAGQASGGAGEEVAVEARQEDDGKAKSLEGVKECEKKDARKKMDSRSEMWKHYQKIFVDGVLQKGKCNYCKNDIAAHTVNNGTSALRKHFNSCKRNPHKNSGDNKQSVLQVTHGDSVHAWKFDPEAIRNSFSAMIIEDELPFAFGEKSGFKSFISVACPRFSIPSRRTCTRDTVRIYFEEKAKLKLFFKEQCERVCLTTDCWTSQQQESFMTVTAHFVCNDWKLHKKIISFFKVKGHKGDDIGKHLQKTLIDWGIEKVMTITVDNASSYDSGIVYMKKELNKANNSIAGAKYLHMRCVAHIVNLIVTDLKEVEISVKRVRGAVRYVKNSTIRISKFKECAQLEKVDTKAFLNLDASTRWNSTYYMLKAVVSYEKVFVRYSDEDPYFALDLLSEKGKEKFIGVLDEFDWENARKMADFLGHFADLTTRVSASLHVTANNFFHEIGEVNLLVKNWMDSDDVLQKSMGQRMKNKFDKYWGNWHESDPSNKGKEKENINLMIFISALDPRYKLSEYTHYAILEMYGDDKGPKVWAAISNCLRDLFEEYRVICGPTIASAQAVFSLEAESSGGRASLTKSLIAKKMRLNNGGSSSSKSELDKFLAEEPEDDGPKFEILAWWKVNSSRFPVLGCLARDVYAIPISTVASESAFSTGGRVLDDFRTYLTPFMVEALVCTQDWLSHATPINIAENTEELTKLEQELIAEYKDIKAKATKSSITATSTSRRFVLNGSLLKIEE